MKTEWAKNINNISNGLIVIVPGMTATCDEFYIVNMVTEALKK
jgi:hypothetical protein